jgi:hypothetical protein
MALESLNDPEREEALEKLELYFKTNGKPTHYTKD